MHSPPTTRAWYMSRTRLGLVFSGALIATLAGWRSGGTVSPTDPARPRRHRTGVRVFQGETQTAGWRAAGAILKRIYLSLGSNIGDREGNLRQAVERLASLDVRVLHAARAYENQTLVHKNQAWRD